MDNNTEKYYKSFGLDRSLPRKFLKKQELNQLFAIPKKEPPKLAPHFYNFEKDHTHQADILFLPWDKQKKNKKTVIYAYALVVVDIGSGATDAEPILKRDEYEKTEDGMVLKTKWNGPTPEDVAAAIKTIYTRKKPYLSIPSLMVTDSGKEFVAEVFQNYLKKNNIAFKKAVGGRHRQIAVVERRNHTLGRAVMMRQFAESSLTGVETTHWVDFFPDLIKAVNDRFLHKPETDASLFKKFGDPWKEKQEILPMGTKVRVMLTQPADYQERLVKDKHFRAGDTRWGQDQYKIVGYVLDPHQPVLYKINKKLKANEHVAYTRQQLQVVDPDEEDVPATILKNQDQEEYVVKKLIDKRTNGRRTEYLVWWKGYKKGDSTWTFKSHIPVAFVQAYEEDNN
jgi:hypothetical protein